MFDEPTKEPRLLMSIAFAIGILGFIAIIHIIASQYP